MDDRRIDGCMGRWIDNGWTDGHMDRWTNRCMMEEQIWMIGMD